MAFAPARRRRKSEGKSSRLPPGTLAARGAGAGRKPVHCTGSLLRSRAMKIRGLLFAVASPAFVACRPQQPPVAAPVAEAAAPEERVVVSTVTVAGEGAEAPRASEADR